MASPMTHEACSSQARCQAMQVGEMACRSPFVEVRFELYCSSPAQPYRSVCFKLGEKTYMSNPRFRRGLVPEQTIGPAKADANRALHVALAEQKRQVHAEAQRAARAALHAAFSAWRVAAGVLVLNVADGDDECAVTDGSSAITGTSSTAASDNSAAADAEPAGTDSADDTGAAGKLSVTIGDVSPVASAVSEGAAPTAQCCTHALTSFWVPQKWQCSTCVCAVPVGTCMQHCAQCDLDYCADCRPAGAEQTGRLHFQAKECHTACEALLEHECKLP